jgi:muramoyltetrapeptide carboxypeptidase
VKLIKPPSLNPDDTIRIVASSSPFEKEAFFKGTDCLQSLGWQITYQGDIFAKRPYLAGDDARRLEELASALTDPVAKAIFFARGGYGSMRLLPMLDRLRIKPKPKIILGYSDITSLLIYVAQRFGWVTFYGPVVAKDIGFNADGLTINTLKLAVTHTKPLGKLKFDQVSALKKGEASAPMLGGCLSLIVAHMGTPYELNTDGKILFLEDINEKPYAIDRMLTQLKIAGKFKKCKGIVFGSLAGANPLEHYEETILDVLKDYDFPILFNFPAGHSESKVTLPLGVKVKIATRDRSLTYLEAALK